MKLGVAKATPASFVTDLAVVVPLIVFGALCVACEIVINITHGTAVLCPMKFPTKMILLVHYFCIHALLNPIVDLHLPYVATERPPEANQL